VVVDGRDRAAVADSVSRLLADPDAAAGMGARGRAWVEQQWQWEQVAERLDGLLDAGSADLPRASG
jgi:phosphatidylinositol alpha-1,6-mannosyltransferase